MIKPKPVFKSYFWLWVWPEGPQCRKWRIVTGSCKLKRNSWEHCNEIHWLDGRIFDIFHFQVVLVLVPFYEFFFSFVLPCNELRFPPFYLIKKYGRKTPWNGRSSMMIRPESWPDTTRPKHTVCCIPDPTRHGPTRLDPTRPDQTRPDPTWPYPTRLDSIRPDPTRPAQTWPDLTRPDLNRPDLTWTDPGSGA